MTHSIIQPPLYCPFPSEVNKYAETVHQQTIEWVRCFYLVTNKTAYQNVCTSKFGWLVARACPNAPQEDLQIVSDWTTWMFLLDDHSEEISKQPIKFATIYARFFNILKGAPAQVHDSPLAYGLQDIRQRLVQKASPEWMFRWLGRVEECWESWLWEATNRTNDITIDLATYIKMRSFTGALYTVIEMIDLTEQINLPIEVGEHTSVQRLTLMANNIFNYANDIFSLKKEIKQGDPHNLVLLLQQEYGLTLQEAVNGAVQIHDCEVQSFIDLESSLPSFGEPIDNDLKCYLSGLRCWIRGHLDWL